MARRVSTRGDQRRHGLRGQLLEAFRAREAEWDGDPRAALFADAPASYTRAASPWAHVIADLRSRRPVVLAGWELARYDTGGVVRRGVHALYRVDPDGRVVEVVPRRDPRDPLVVIDWEEEAGP